ncbi:hypothetical protein [Streptomyces albidoflavus]|uniref:hypothetical protein n=1 Tax=Streptomyces albidoflavus TaxID=1886 RepID=UPI003318CCD6
MINTITRYLITCDNPDCDAEHRTDTADSTLTARIAAGIDGWKHTKSRPGMNRRSWDYCPNCEVPT